MFFRVNSYSFSLGRVRSWIEKVRRRMTRKTRARRYPIFILCRDRVTTLRALIAWLESAGHENIYLIDNNSSFPPLLEFYEETPHRVIWLEQNFGHRALWDSGLLDKLGVEDRYVVTDPDVIPIRECPKDAVAYFDAVLDRYPLARKVGFGIKIDDLPHSYALRDSVVEWESQFWKNEITPGLYEAPIDTTFALYRRHSGHHTEPAIRTGLPYMLRHLPWYIDSGNLSEEERYYRNQAKSGLSYWSTDRLSEKFERMFENMYAKEDIEKESARVSSVDSPPSTDKLGLSLWLRQKVKVFTQRQ